MQPDAMIAPGPDQWPPRSASGEPQPLAIQTKYELDPFQKHAVLGIHAGDHVFVTAKTGSGKTFVGEYLIAFMLAQGKRVFYTTPIKSLSNQKYHDLKKLFPTATVGILTGDIKMCPDAQIVVMTAEILRNLFYKRGTATEGVGLTAAVSLEGVGGIVMDEVHYIQDPDRGHVWEETLILCASRPSVVADTVVPQLPLKEAAAGPLASEALPNGGLAMLAAASPASVVADTVVPPVVATPIQLVLLSATLPSAASLAGWLADLHQRRTWLLSTTYRIVPLVHGILENKDGGWRVKPLLDSKGHWVSDAYTGWLRDRKALADAAEVHKKAVAARKKDGYAGPSIKDSKVRIESPVERLHRTIEWLSLTAQLPALFFVFSRRECERLASLVSGTHLDDSAAAGAQHIIDFHLSRHRATLEKSPQYHAIRDLLVRGIAFHHSGLQPLLKEIVEILFTRGFVKILFATETFSVGLNMPTKTVVFLELEKWCDGGQKRLLRPDEYIQMAGRAGRRGLDTQGLVLYEPMKDPVDSGDLKSLLTGALPPLESRMRFHYDFILKVAVAKTGSKLQIAEQSYWAVQQQATRVSLGLELESLKERVDTLNTTLSADQKKAFREKAALEHEVACTVNAKRKKAQQALTRWSVENDWAAKLQKSYDLFHAVETEYMKKQAACSAWDAAPLLALGPLEACLTDWGFLDSDGLTPLGVSATEVNEGHGILMPLLAFSDRTADLTAEEIACVLAGFLNESRVDDPPTLGASGLRRSSLEVLWWIDAKVADCQKSEAKHGVIGPTAFWELSSLWVCIAARWLAGAGLTEIAVEFGLFEGNVLRGLMRIANLLEEWGSLATLRRDLATLEKLGSLRFLRDEVVVDSLYLRL
jgi:superfamily II RNA helicase